MTFQNSVKNETLAARELTIEELDQVAGGRHHHPRKRADDVRSTSAAGATAAKAPAGAGDDAPEVEKETETGHGRRGRDG